MGAAAKQLPPLFVGPLCGHLSQCAQNISKSMQLPSLPALRKITIYGENMGDHCRMGFLFPFIIRNDQYHVMKEPLTINDSE